MHTIYWHLGKSFLIFFNQKCIILHYKLVTQKAEHIAYDMSPKFYFK